MFDFVRKYTKVIAIPLFLLIILAFILVGVDGYKGFSGNSKTVAKVGSHNITQSDWDATHKNEVDRIRAQMPSIDAKLLDSPEARYATLERLVRDRVLTDAAQDKYLAVTDARLARELQQDPTIGALRKPDGTLDMARYRELAASQGLTPEGYEARVRNDLSVRQLEAGVLASAFAPAAQAAISLNAFFERRDIQWQQFSPVEFASKVSLVDADIEAFYQANQALFQAAESASVEYVVLDLESVKKSITLNDADVRAYYDQNVARLSGKEERRASHILINAPKDMPSADRQKARDRATALSEQARKFSDGFADLARKNSQDIGSAPNGGDLDFFGRGAMVKPFEEAAFSMKKGEVSEPVESDFGFHIIKLTDIKTPKQKSFEELRTGIESDLRNQQAQRKFAEVAEAFSNGVYEQSDNLKAIAEKLKLEMKTANNVARVASATQTGVLANPKLLAALFSPDAIEKKRNTEAVEIAVNQLAAARVTQYSAARTLPLVDVRNNVRDRLIASRSAELAKKDGAEKLAAWKTNGATTNLANSLVVSRDQEQKIPAAVRDAAMRTDTAKLPAWIGVDLGSQGYAVVRVNKVLERNAPTDAAAKQERAQYAQWIAKAEGQAYFEVLKKQYNVQITVPRPAPGAALLQAAGE